MAITSYYELAGTATEEVPVIDFDEEFDAPAFDQEAFDREMNDVIVNTAIEREWTQLSGFEPFQSDKEILDAAANGEMRRVTEGVGFLARQYLGRWEPERSDPDHEYHYSPPYLRPEAVAMLGYIGHKWARTIGWHHRLTVTSMARSLPYQQNLNDTVGKMAISPEIGLSTHVFGLAFDIDACGLYLSKNHSPFEVLDRDLDNIASDNDMDIYDRFTAANPRMHNEHTGTVALGHTVLLDILKELADVGKINVVEEFSGTSNNCFHVAVNPNTTA